MAKGDNMRRKNLINSGISSLIATILISFLESFWSLISFGITFVVLFVLSFGIHAIISKITIARRFYAKHNLIVLGLITYYLVGLIFSFVAFSLGGFNGIPVWAQIILIPFFALISPIMLVVA